jgi:hypothetical protein
LSIANSNFSEIAFSDGYFHEVGSLEFSFHEIDELVLVIFNCRNPNLSFQILVLRSWGLTMLDGEQKSTIFASIVYVPNRESFSIKIIIFPPLSESRNVLVKGDPTTRVKRN